MRLEAFFKLLQLKSGKSVSISFRIKIISEVNYWGICNNPIIVMAMLSWGMLEVLPLIKDPEKKCTMLMRVSLYKTNVIVSVNGAS